MALVIGKLGTPTRLSSGVEAQVYEVPANKRAVVDIDVSNDAASATVRLRIGAASNTAANLEAGTVVPQNGGFERTRKAMSAGEKVFAHASGSGVTVRVSGVEEDV